MRILVIEDEARIQGFLARGLEAEGYTVVSAGDGREGLGLATGARWDLVVLDLLLPGLNGLQVLRELHRSKPELPVVILSARGDVQTKLRGFELGADRLRRKAVLPRRAARADSGAAPWRGDLRRRARPARRPNVVLDVARRQAAVGGRTVDLSDREFRLLHHLLVHVGEVVSRERLLAEVWGYDFDPGSNVVDVCVPPAAAESSGRRRRSGRCGMRVIDWLRRNPAEVAWAAFAVANSRRWSLAGLETIPFHFVWIS